MLSDEQKRAAYDRFGKAGVDPNAAGGFGGGQGGFGGFGGMNGGADFRAPSATSSPIFSAADEAAERVLRVRSRLAATI